MLSLEVEYKNKLEGIDSEVALRARSGIAAAEAREAASERRAVMREAECQQRESQGRKRVIQCLFNVDVLEAMSERKASTL